jgi:DNA-binding response OmpR family regulator
MERTILIVEDEARMRQLLADFLRREGLRILEAENGKTALDLFDKSSVDLMILDLMMPLLDGLSVCTCIRNKSDLPIIILTAKSEEDDKLLGYELGADDYVTKPFNPKILTAKVKALLKRIDSGKPGASTPGNGILKLGELAINELSHDVYIKNEKLHLTPKEYDLLLYFAKNRGIAFSRDKLLNDVWGFDYYGDFRTVDTHIKRLRQKLGTKSSLIATVRGNGYKLEVDA